MQPLGSQAATRTEGLMATAKNFEIEHEQSSPQPPAGTLAEARTELLVLSLDDLGVIRECSPASAKAFGYLPDELVGGHIRAVLPQLPETGLVQNDRIESRLAHRCRCGFRFEAQHRDGHRFGIELFINRLGYHNVSILVRSLDVNNAGATIDAIH